MTEKKHINNTSHNSFYDVCLSDKTSKFDWNLTSENYAMFRPPPPPSYYLKLLALGIGSENQRILDLGTGVGHIANILAKQNCEVVGVDISSNQINFAKKLAQQQNLSAHFENIAVEEIVFPTNSFDVAIAMQSWPYFNKKILCPKLKNILKPNGLIMIGNFDHLPRHDMIARETEKLMLKFNPDFLGYNYDGYVPPFPKEYHEYFQLKSMFYYDEPIPFTKESWHGRIFASQAIGASLSEKDRNQFNLEMKQLLNKIADENFSILHRISAHIMVFKS